MSFRFYPILSCKMIDFCISNQTDTPIQTDYMLQTALRIQRQESLSHLLTQLVVFQYSLIGYAKRLGRVWSAHVFIGYKDAFPFPDNFVEYVTAVNEPAFLRVTISKIKYGDGKKNFPAIFTFSFNHFTLSFCLQLFQAVLSQKILIASQTFIKDVRLGFPWLPCQI